MRVLFSIMVFHPVVGGTEASARDLAAALARQGHDVDVLTLRHPGAPAHEALDGIHVHRVLWGAGRHAVFALSYLASAAWQLFRHRHADVIQVYFAYLDAVALALIKPLVRAKTVVRLSGGGASGDLARLRRLKLTRVVIPLLRRLDRFVVVSRQMRDELIEAGIDPARIRVIPNGVDALRFAPSGQGAPPRHAVTVVRLSPEKGVDVLLQAWKLVQAQRAGGRLTIVGDGPQRRALEASAASLDLAGVVEFAGEVADVRPYLHAGSLFVLPSRSEGLPNALLQAMAAGLPCVAARVGGVPEVMDDRVHGRLVEPERPAALAEAILELLADPALARQYGAAARLRVAADHSFDDMVARYLEVYNGAAQGGS